MDTPDFAYPKTVAKRADSDLKEAVKNHDPHAAINALMRMYAANEIIDPETRQKSIETVTSTAERFADSPMQGIFKALLANLYFDYYQDKRWVYDRRKLPMTPLPKELSEWSGDQFKDKIRLLCEESIANPAVLSALRLADYPDIIICDKESAPYFPTLLDFAYQNTLRLSNRTDKFLSDAQIAEMGLRNATSGGDKVYWQYVLTKAQDNKPASWQSLVDQNSAEQLASLYLIGEYESLTQTITVADDDESSDKPSEKEKNASLLYTSLTDFLSKHPSCPFAKTLTYYRNKITEKSISLKTPTICAAGNAIKVAITNINAPAYDIAVYKLTDKRGSNGGIDSKVLKTLQPMAKYPQTCDKSAPFTHESTINIPLEAPGYYAIVPLVNGQVTDNWISPVRCIPAMPIALSNVSPSKVLVLNPHDGAPMKDIPLVLANGKNKQSIQPTDDMGLATVPDKLLADHKYWQVGLVYGGKTYQFDNVSITGPGSARNDTASTARIFTDRAIYHPGDQINWMAVVYDSQISNEGDISSSLCPDKNIEAVLYDANYQSVDTIKVKTDEYGRASGRFMAPTDGLTGRFTIKVSNRGLNSKTLGQQAITVSDYKMPDFEITDVKTLRNVDGNNTVTVKGRAVSYSGVPLANTTITAVVSKASWWRWFTPSEEACSAEVTTDADGAFSITMNATQLKYDKSSPYYIAELSASSASGSTAKAATSFSMGPQYIINIESIGNVDALKPFKPDVTVVSADGEKASIDLLWAIKSDSVILLHGKAGEPIDISGIKPGVYSFVVNAADESLAKEASAQMTIYNTATDIVPSENSLWLADNTGYTEVNDKDEIELLIGTPREHTIVYYILSDSRKGQLVRVDKMEYAKGYHRLTIPVGNVSDDNMQVTLLCVKDCKTITETINIGQRKKRSIKIIGETFRDRLLPGATESWKLHLENQDGTPVKGAVALDMYNKALEAIMPHSFSLSLDPVIYARNYLSIGHAYNYDRINQFIWSIGTKPGNGLVVPVLQMYDEARGRYACQSSNEVYLTAGISTMKMARSESAMAKTMVYDTAGMVAETVEEEAPCDESEGGAANGTAPDNYEYRDADVPMAVWAPSLTTDADGNLVYSFTVPNANTTWRLRAVAWSASMLTGQLMRDFVANKPVMVQPNAPRFLRAGDQATILASVINNTDSVSEVSTTIELINPATSEVFSSSVHTDTIQPMGTATVSIAVEAPADAAAVCYRVRSTSGGFSDGERDVIRILPSQSQLIETTPFYLNPGDTTYTTILPSASDARLSLTFSENPAWTIVSALPGLREDIGTTANSAVSALLSAAVSRGLMQANPRIAEALKKWSENPSDSALVSMLEKNDDLKLAMLNCTPWVEAARSDTERMASLALIFNDKDINRSIGLTIRQLKKLQNTDGGWKWGDWCTQSSYWVTGNVLGQLGYLRSLGWLPKSNDLDQIIKKALAYYDDNSYDKKPEPDMLYAIIRAYYKDIPASLKGQRVVTATVNDILKHWKSYTNPARKSIAAMVLYNYNYPTKARKLMSSISEFGVWTPQQGLTFPSVNSLSDYATLLEAYATIEPTNRAVDGLRQQLIVRKQGTDWGSAAVSSQVIVSILQSGSTWTVPAKGAVITAGDKVIEPTSPIESATGSLRANLSPYAGKQLTIRTTGAGPAYGAVYAQYSQTMDSISPAACDDLSIEKRIAVRRGNDWVYAPDSLAVGDRVQIVLTIHCKRNLDYVTIIDDRAAAFEPVDQAPGWIYSEGVGFYRENRDSFTGLYIDCMRPGTYQLIYEMNVTIAGRFSSGVAAIQSQYAPELSAHSAGAMLHVK